ncbi:MAG: 16S rRNA (uracil(1498)-N(3))-methyltransferase [Gammaproteobacteria bacterium]|nr:16S rRNA (uracil(1498)-N(3))-methyltransferase [Gammaproteobacteria bacterium]
MPVTRIYHPESLRCGETVQLNADASSHLIRVLRTKLNSPVILFNGDGFEYHCTTLDDNAKKTLLSINSKIASGKESNINITLIQGLSRQHRMEFTIQKSVELGVNRIVPVICERSNTKLTEDQRIKKLTHWRKIAISACEQSGRSIIPDLTEITVLDNVNQLLNRDALKLVLNPESNLSLKQLSSHQTAVAARYVEMCIGPEGGLTKDEIAFLENSQFTNICFGPRILRTETAGPAVISALQMLWGDF